jgi:hypothetical protein
MVYYYQMPEISRFFGIIVRMFAEPNVQHNEPHFHVYYQEHSAVYTIEPIGPVTGDLPLRQRRMVEAWAEIHRQELLQDWHSLQNGRLPGKIAPLA